jgi:hypothetical protein
MIEVSWKVVWSIWSVWGRSSDAFGASKTGTPRGGTHAAGKCSGGEEGSAKSLSPSFGDTIRSG